MEYIYYQNDNTKDPTFTRYKYSGKQGIQKTIIHKTLYEIIRISQDTHTDTSSFLLHDDQFSFFQFDIFKIANQPLTSQDLEHIIYEKELFIKVNKNINAQFWMSYVDDIYVNSQKKNQLVGEKGNIMFRLYMIYIDDICLNTFKSWYGKNIDRLVILPQSLYSILFIKHTMQRENFLLLSITTTSAKCLSIQKGFYAQGSSINLGLHILKNIYNEHGISQFWNKSEVIIQKNSLALNLVKKGLQFYAQMLCKWLIEQGLKNNDIFLISSILKNELFIDIFHQIYKKYHQDIPHYIIPFHHSSILKNYGRKWSPDEINILVYLNRKRIFGETPITFLQSPNCSGKKIGFSTKKL